jgi:hypothetical protein
MKIMKEEGLCSARDVKIIISDYGRRAVDRPAAERGEKLKIIII